MPYHSSGAVTLKFNSGRSWEMPDMLPLYVALGWTPPQEFMDDVMNSALLAGGRVQTRSIEAKPMALGYLRKTPDESGTPASEIVPELPGTLASNLPEGFLTKLTQTMQQAKLGGGRVQTRGLSGQSGFR